MQALSWGLVLENKQTNQSIISKKHREAKNGVSSPQLISVLGEHSQPCGSSSSSPGDLLRPLSSLRVPHSTPGYTCSSNAMLDNDGSPQCGLPTAALSLSGHWPVAGWNWHRAGNFQPLCQFFLSFVYQNWLELLTGSPKGRTEVTNNHSCLHSISWGRQSQQHNTALTSRHAHLVSDSPQEGWGEQGRNCIHAAKCKRAAHQMPFVNCCSTGFWNQFSQSWWSVCLFKE